jgi:hypothetical protein
MLHIACRILVILAPSNLQYRYIGTVFLEHYSVKPRGARIIHSIHVQQDLTIEPCIICIYIERETGFTTPRQGVLFTIQYGQKSGANMLYIRKKYGKWKTNVFFLLSGLYCEGLVCKKISNNICFFPKWTLWISQNEDFYVDSKHINLPYP